MMRKLNKIDALARRLNKGLTDDISNNRTFCIVTYSALGLVAAVMTVMNIVTDKGYLTLATALFALLCGSNVIMAICGFPVT